TGMVVAGRCEGEATVSTEHRCDAVQRRWARSGIPGQLRVVMSMDVYEAGSRDEATSVDDAGIDAELVNRDESAVADADVATLTRTAGPVDHERASDQGVGHESQPAPRRGCSQKFRGAYLRWRAPRPRRPATCRGRCA